MSGLDASVRYVVSKKGLKDGLVASPQEFSPHTLRSLCVKAGIFL